MYSESIRVRENKLRTNQIILTVNIFCTKSRI